MERAVAVNVRRLTWILITTCLLVEIGLFLGDLFISYADLTDLEMIRGLFNITREDGLASFFGVAQMLLAAVTAWITYAVVRHSATSSRRQKAGWLILAMFLTYMAVDDGAAVHERVGSAFKQLSAHGQQEAVDEDGQAVHGLTYFPSYPWQLLFVPFFAAGGLFMVLFLRREMNDTLAMGMILAALALWAAAVGLDFIEGLTAEHPLNLHTWIREATPLSRYDVRHFSKSIEEVCEMFGTTLLWSALVRNLARMRPLLSFRFGGF